MLLGVALGHVVAVATPVLLGRVPRRQRAPIVAEHDPLEQIRHGRPRCIAAHPAIGGQDRMDAVPQFAADDRRMFGLVPLLLVPQLAKLCPVAEELVDVPLVDRSAVAGLAVLRGPRLRSHAIQFQLLDQRRTGAKFDEALKDVPDELGLALVRYQPPVLDVIAQRWHAAHPHAFALAGCDLVADAFARDLTFELREGQQDVQHQPSHGCRRVELLGDRYERDAVALEHFDHLGEVRQAAREAVDLVDDDYIDLASFNVRHQAAQCRALHVVAREGGIIVVVSHRHPGSTARWRSHQVETDGRRAMIETLLGGLLGGAFHLAPEILKWLDRKGERGHELAMQDKALEFEKIRGAQRMSEIGAGADAAWNVGAIETLREAVRTQGEKTGVRWADALSCSVRPVITYWFMALYCAAKTASFAAAVTAGAGWGTAILHAWTEADQALWAGVLNFWFLGRVFDRVRP